MNFAYPHKSNGETFLNSESLYLQINPYKIFFFRIGMFLLVFLWCLGFIPGLFTKISNDLIIFSPILKKIYSSVCFQKEERTLTIFGISLFVCSRCTGIYFGTLIFSFISIFSNKIVIRRKLFIAALSILLSDVLLNSSGIFSYSKNYAFATGFFFGSSAFLYILNILENEFFIKE